MIDKEFEEMFFSGASGDDIDDFQHNLGFISTTKPSRVKSWRFCFFSERKTMDWLQFLQIVCVPAFVWLVHKYGEMRKDLNDFKVQVAKEYATQVHINRLELKIDDLRQLIWETYHEQNTTRNKKQ